MGNDVSDHLLVLPQDRVIGLWEGGDPDGVPVLFHHGTPSGRSQAMLGREAARRQNVHLVSFNRPGYGDSTDTPPSLASVGVDTLRVADALGIGDFAVLGVSGGGPYALATGVADPARVRGIGVAAGIGPWRLIEPAEEGDRDRPLLALADAGNMAAALEGFRAQATTDFDDLLSLDDETMVESFFEGTPEEDIRWLDRGARRLWGADMRDALKTYDGYARDNVAWGGTWDIEVSNVRPRTWLWYGEHDRMVPVEHGRWLAARIHEATLVVRPGKGHGSTSFEFWDDMFATLRKQFLAQR